MFATKLGLFSIRTVVVFIPIRLEQPINLIALASLNLFEHLYVLPILFDTFVNGIEGHPPHITQKHFCTLHCSFGP